MKKTMKLAAFLLAVTTLLTTAFFVSAADAYEPEIGDGYVSFDYSRVFTSICDNKKSAKVEKDVAFEGKTAIKVTPTPDINDAGWINLDGGGEMSKSKLVTLPDYKYVTIEYYYDTKSPKYDGNLAFRYLGTGLGGKVVEVASAEKIVVGAWATATFDFGGKIEDKINSEIGYLTQTHFLPFGKTNPTVLTSEDVLYVSKITFSKNNPEADKPHEVEFTKGNPDADGDAPEIGDGYVSFDYSRIFSSICDNKKSAKVERDVEFEGKTAIKVTPTPGLDDAPWINLDSLGGEFAKSKLVTLPDYKYVTIEYYYDTKAPKYDGNLVFRYLGAGLGGKIAEVASAEKIVVGAWATATFDFGGKIEDKINSEIGYLTQTHFLPFGKTNPTVLTSEDVLYVSKITFSKNNPEADKPHEVEFTKGNPDAEGDAPGKLSLKAGEKFKLPECPFTLSYGDFSGWNLGGGEFGKPGDEVTMGETPMTIAAVWKERYDYPEYSILEFCDYQNGIVDNNDTAAVFENVVEDGKNAVKFMPNISSAAGRITFEGYRYRGAMIELGYYKWLTIEYKYISEKPVSPKMQIGILNGGLTGSYSRESEETIVTDKWSYATFDLTGTVPDLTKPQHFLVQMHMRPFGLSVKPSELDKNDTMYIASLVFSADKPAFGEHEPYMTGYSDGTFKPNKTITRAEACTVVARLLEAEDKITGTPSFTDVAADKWYAKYIGFCEEKGLLKSYSGAFLPDQAITRAEFAELVYNMGLVSATDKEIKFTDVAETHPKYAAIKAAASAGLITGYADGTFLPDRTITRAQAVTVINRARGTSKTASALSSDYKSAFSDVDSSYWAYADIAEASTKHSCFAGAWVGAKSSSGGGENEDDTGIDYTAGNAKVAELDKLSEERIKAIRATKSEHPEITGKTYYVSPNGDDTKDGLTPATAWKTMKKVNTLALTSGGVGVLFERGGVWRERLYAQGGITYSAYGEGDKPKLYGSPENGADASKWTLISENKESGAKIWKYSNEGMVDVGNIVFDGKSYARKTNPRYVDGKFMFDKNTAFEIEKHLDTDLTFFHKADSKLNGSNVPDTGATGAIYLRCDKGNPGDLYNEIEFSTRGNVVSIRGNGVTIDNLCIMYGGSHGVGSGTVKDLTVRNCEIGWIGGSFQSYNSSTGVPTRFGNGVEVYGGCDGYTVKNCYIWQNYDAGVTHQFSSRETRECIMDNVTYSGNLIEDCVYSIEYFLSSASDNAVKRSGKNILFEDNILRRAGYGFGSTRPDGNVQCHIRAWTSSNPFENYVIKNNYFDRSTWGLIQVTAAYKAWFPKMEGNTFIQGYGNNLAQYGIVEGTMYKMYANAEKTIKETFGDVSANVFYVERIPDYKFSPEN